jgi:hypothetical protein
MEERQTKPSPIASRAAAATEFPAIALAARLNLMRSD